MVTHPYTQFGQINKPSQYMKLNQKIVILKLKKKSYNIMTPQKIDHLHKNLVGKLSCTWIVKVFFFSFSQYQVYVSSSIFGWISIKFLKYN